jgi:hypothetical protein
MWIEIETSPKNVECANVILAQAIKELEKDPNFVGFEMKPHEIEAAAKFRRSLLKAFLRSATKQS